MATAKTLTTLQLAAAFGVTSMTIWLWRGGTATKEPLPFIAGEKMGKGYKVTFRLSEAKKWAKKNDVPFALDPEAVLQGVVALPPAAQLLGKASKNVKAKSKTPIKSAKKVSKATAKRPKH